MNTHADKLRKQQQPSVANAESVRHQGASPMFQLVDNRPEAAAQLKLQEMANARSSTTPIQANSPMPLSLPAVQFKGLPTSSLPIQRVHQDSAGWWVTAGGKKFKKKKQAEAEEERERFGFLKVNTYRASIKKNAGNYTLGTATSEDANQIGADWIGKKLYGNYNVSDDKKRQYRKPALKANTGLFQANVEEREGTEGAWTSNGHIHIL